MRIGLDATPLLGARTGIGRYVAELVRHLPEVLQSSDELVATAFTVRGGSLLRRDLPPGVSARNRRFPARLLQEMWARTEWPPVGLLAGRLGVFHGTNFVLPPPGRAAGVVTVHDLAFLHHSGTVSGASRRYVDLVPRSLARAAIVCVPSASIAAEVADAYPATVDRILVTPLGVDPAWAETPAPDPAWLAARGLDRDYVLFIGTLEPRKDLATVLTAYRRSVGRGSSQLPLLALAGPSGWGPELDLSGIPDGSVVRLGRQPDGDLRALVAGARALVYPSRYEGFGLPVLEAFACGTPLLATDIPTTREILGSEAELAALFPVGDADALAELLVGDAHEDPGRRKRRRSLAAGWSWSRTAATTAEAYRRAAG